ncbi:MAG: DUF86 domain-containing protein [Anaerolineae bacterium]|nr:DUF86 domain-containing protein [Anaerolineae bacterium]
MNERDEVRLRDMLDAAREVVAFVQGETRVSLEYDRKLVRALMMSISIIGEAAARVSQECQDAAPQIPWPQIIGMRNRIIHGYSGVNLERLWKTAIEDIPSLISELEKLVTPE